METFEWYVIRATGTVAYLLLYLSVMSGLYTQVQKSRRQKMTFTLYWHESLGDWALILTLGHVLFTLFDSYFHFQWMEIFIPFQTDYQTIPMALGILAFYFLVMTILTSKFRKKMAYQKWRKLHSLNPILYIFVTLHGIFQGTDFQGTVLAAVNILPFIILGPMLLKNKKLNSQG